MRKTHRIAAAPTAAVLALSLVAASLLLLPVLLGQSATASASGPYRTCADLRQRFQHGVAKSLRAAQKQYRHGNYRPTVRQAAYLRNKQLDRDIDGTACEHRRPTTTPTPTPVPTSTPKPSPLPTWTLSPLPTLTPTFPTTTPTSTAPTPTATYTPPPFFSPIPLYVDAVTPTGLTYLEPYLPACDDEFGWDCTATVTDSSGVIIPSSWKDSTKRRVDAVALTPGTSYVLETRENILGHWFCSVLNPNVCNWIKPHIDIERWTFVYENVNRQLVPEAEIIYIPL